MTEFRLSGMHGRQWYEREEHLMDEYDKQFMRAWRRCVWPSKQRLWLVLVVGGYIEACANPAEVGAEFGEAAWMLQSDHVFGASAVALGLETFRP